MTIQIQGSLKEQGVHNGMSTTQFGRLFKRCSEEQHSFQTALDAGLFPFWTRTDEENLKSIIYKEASVRKLAGELLNLQPNATSENINNKLLFNSVELENYLIDYALLHKSAAGTNYFGGLKNEIETILNEIEQELNK